MRQEAHLCAQVPGSLRGSQGVAGVDLCGAPLCGGVWNAGPWLEVLGRTCGPCAAPPAVAPALASTKGSSCSPHLARKVALVPILILISSSPISSRMFITTILVICHVCSARRGLIQDHVVAGVLLTKRDTWLTKAQYMQLVYIACNAWQVVGRAGAGARGLREVGCGKVQ